MRFLNRKILYIAALASVLGIANVTAAAPNSPNAADLLHELEQDRRITLPPKKPKVDLNFPSSAQKGNDQLVKVDKVVIVWQEEEALKNFKLHRLDKQNAKDVLEAELSRLTEDICGKESTFNELVGTAEKVTLRLRALGFPAAIAYLPNGGLVDGTLKMKTVLGTYDELLLDNRSRMTTGSINKYTSIMPSGGLIHTRSLNKSLLVLNDLPGMQVKANLAPGDKFGTAKLLLNADDYEIHGGSLYADNQGNRSTGRYRYGLNYHMNNLSRIGDQFQGNYLITNHKDMKNFSFAYELPLNRHGMKWKASISRMTYEFIGQSNLQYFGDSTSFETSIDLPYDRDLLHSNYVNLGFVNRKVADTAVSYKTQKTTHAAVLSARGYKRSDRDTFSYNFSNTWGRLVLDNSNARDMDNHYKREGAYTHGNTELLYHHYFSPVTSMQLTVSAQTSWGRSLDSSEKFYIAGPNGVRAYPGGEANGDVGVLATAELQMPTPVRGLKLTAFYDVGYAKDAKADVTGSYGNKYLAGAGLGLSYSKARDWYCKLDWAVPITNRYSETYGKDIRNMLWFRFVKQI